MPVTTVDFSGIQLPNARVLFISDLHLDSASPAKLRLTEQFLRSAHQATALFIVGDLFEYWLGDDAADPHLQSVYDAIGAVSASGTQVHLMHGNRDFLLGNDFAHRVNATVHSNDVLQVVLHNMTITLLHGDTLCTDDTAYQALRKQVRDPVWQNAFLSLSIDDRIAQANQLREKSREAVAGKQTDIMDVNANAVEALCKQYPCDYLVHGHTHRPGEHPLQLSTDSNARSLTSQSSDALRVVLGDWHDDHAQIAEFDGTQLLLKRFAS